MLEQGKERLAEGEWVVIFPGGHAHAAGRDAPLRRQRRAARAPRDGRLIVPVAHDAGYFWPRRGLIKKPGTIRVVIGPPINAAGREPREVNAEAQEWIERHSRH